jgi:hypothetical protein
LGYSYFEAPVDPTNFDWVMRHIGKSCSPFHRWRQLLRTVSPSGWGALRCYADRVMTLATDTRVLFTAAKVLNSGGPKAPGPNRLHLSDLADDELWSMVTGLSQAIRSGKYRPGEQLIVWAWKKSGTGRRPIAISDVQDKVVEKAFAMVLRPMLDVLFDPLSFACRPRRTREVAIAVAERLARSGHPVWLAHDLRDAYRNVPLPRLLDVVFNLLPCPRLRQYLSMSLPPQASGVGGLKQGGPLSSIMLEVYLNHFLDRPMRKAALPIRVIRYADDVLIIAPDISVAERADAELRKLLHPTGLQVKQSFAEAMSDLRENHIDWLGYRFKLAGGKFQVRLANDAFIKLKQSLTQLHAHVQAAARSIQVIEGWIGQLGPCNGWEDTNEVIRRTRETASECGFGEIATDGRLLQLWGAAAGRWKQTRRSAFRDRRYLTDGPVSAPTPTSVVW